MNKFTTLVFSLVIAIVLTCGSSNKGYAQTTEAKQNTPEIKSSFLGHWKGVQDPNRLVEIYKEESLVIVRVHADVRDGSGSNKYPVAYGRGNKIMVDFGYGLTPLTITDDGTKITFLGNDYMKQ